MVHDYRGAIGAWIKNVEPRLGDAVTGDEKVLDGIGKISIGDADDGDVDKDHVQNGGPGSEVPILEKEIPVNENGNGKMP